MEIIDDTDILDYITINGRISKKLFNKVVRPQLEYLKKLRIECSGMGKLLQSGVVVPTEEYIKLIDPINTIDMLNRRITDLELTIKLKGENNEQ